MENDVILSVCTVTYNQANYIAKTIDSFLMQKTNFKFQVIIGDDCSTDGTTEIIKEYAEKYPEIIKPIFREKNIGAGNNSLDVYNHANTKYIAICDGDDYWTDENKLQIQVDYLENHPELVGCFHKSVRKNIVNPEVKDIYFPQTVLKNVKEVYTNKDIQKKYFIETCSVMYRFDKYKEDFLSTYPQKIVNGDTYMLNYFSLHGNIGYIDRLMSVKTMNDLGIWNSQKQSTDEKNMKYAEEIVRLPIVLNNLYKRFNKKCLISIEYPFNLIINTAIKLNREDIILKIIFKYWNDYINSQNIYIEELFKSKNKYKKLFNISLFISGVLLLILITIIIKHYV